MQIFLRTWQEHWLVNNLAQLPTQSKFLLSCTILLQNHTLCFFLCPSSKAQLTWRCKIFNLSYRESYLYKFGDQHILHNSRTKLAFFNKLRVQKQLILWPLLLQYDLFYCNVQNDIKAVATCIAVTDCLFLVYAFVLSPGKESMFQWGQIQPPPPPTRNADCIFLICVFCFV